MENVFALSHASDIDGVGSAALVRMKYKVPLSNIFFSEYSTEGIDYVNLKLRPHYKKGIILFIMDLGVDDWLIGSYKKLLESVQKGGGKVFWFDHHPWTDKAIMTLTPKCEKAVIGENTKYCATEITFMELGLSGAFAKRFKEIVHYSDFNIKPSDKKGRDLIGHYALSITSYNALKSRGQRIKRLRHMVDVISDGKFLDERIKRDSMKFNEINERRLHKMLGAMIVREKFAVGFSKIVQSTAGCIAVREKAARPIGIYINMNDWKGHIRCETNDISILARNLGGGGHPHASGFMIEPRKFGYLRTRSQKEKFADYLEENIDNYVEL